jgi:tRNA-specific 2-thiouridylase
MNDSIDKKCIVAMSGGVDSSVSAILLKEQGYEPIGISMQVWDYRKNGGCSTRATCCSPDDFTDARKVAASINVPYYVFDFENYFNKEVIQKFVETYKKGQTPNPCVDCNSKVKFKELRNRAKSFGVNRVATGHYAQIIDTDGTLRLARGVDKDKDQSYFLYGLKYSELKDTVFPVGHMTKPEVREIARKAGLQVASKPESQDICFVSGSVQDFLVRIGAKRQAGQIIKRDGTVMGEHEGVHNYTVGQRKGLRLGTAGEALYVLEIRPENNQVIVGKKEELEREGFAVTELTWLDPIFDDSFSKQEEFEFEAKVQVRHRHPGVPVNVKILKNGEAEVSFKEEWAIASPGQAAVFYDVSNTFILGGGRIKNGMP